MSGKAKVLFQEIADKSNNSSKVRKMVERWIGHYDGKIIQFTTDMEKFYLVVTKVKMEIRDGDYPSPDISLKGSSKLISDIFTGRKDMVEAMKSWQLVVFGAGHEGFTLQQIVARLIPEG